MPVKNNRYMVIWFSILVVLILIISLGIYSNWFELISLSQNWQRYFHQQLVKLLLQAKTAPHQTGLLLICFSLLYGIIHSAGPGHGKVIISTYLVTQPKQLKRSLLLTLLSALMQGLVAIVLISGLLIMLNLSTHFLSMSEYWLELMSYLFIVMIGLFLCYRAIKQLINMVKKSANNPLLISQIRPIDSENHVTHAHLEHCACCGHKHLPDEKDLNHAKGWLGDLGIIVTIGLRPCSGALLVLIFSYTIGVFCWGLVATLAMSIGTAITTSMFALLVHFARKLATRLLTHTKRTSCYYLLASQSIALIGGLLFIIMGLVLCIGILMSYQPIGNPILAN